MKYEINTVFAFVNYFEEDGKLSRMIYTANTDEWKNEKYTSETSTDDSYKLLCGLGFSESSECHYDIPDKMSHLSNEQIKNELIKYGFEYDEELQDFINKEIKRNGFEVENEKM